jgi:hypothetical protein
VPIFCILDAALTKIRISSLDKTVSGYILWTAAIFSSCQWSAGDDVNYVFHQTRQSFWSSMCRLSRRSFVLAVLAARLEQAAVAVGHDR